jgi:hypothetical protein
MGAGPVTVTREVPGTARRWRSWRGVLLTLAALIVVAAVGTYLTAPRPGGTMDPASTSPSGAHALVTLLRDHGVEVVVANTVADVEGAARPDTLLLVAQSQFLTDNTLLERLAKAPGDLLLVEPTSRTRTALTPRLRMGTVAALNSRPNCPLREANRAGTVKFGPTDSYVARGGLEMTSCYDGALVRYRDDGRTVTAVGSTAFMTNEGLLEEGNAALAMNLAGDRPRVVWYAPQRIEGETSSPSSLYDLIPDNVSWIVWQLWLVVLLAAFWKGRRIGPLVSEELPVVVRTPCAPRRCSGCCRGSAWARARSRRRW